jgi:AraC family transcriptional regulator, regulatory protein of adaptative response / methylated-DNA-[protein]-cysteine methyltransferase
MVSTQQADLNPTQAWQQVLARDKRAVFVYAVASTGIFCRPSCPSRRPSLNNVRFFQNPAAAATAGYRACMRCTPLGDSPDAVMVAKACRYLAEQPATLNDLAQLTGMSAFALQRKFIRVLGVSPKQFAAQLKAASVRRTLSAGTTVTEAIYEAGYGSSSRFYEQAAPTLGMSPTRFRERGAKEVIRFATAPCELGVILVASTERGVCSVLLGDDPNKLERELREQFKAAQIELDANPAYLKQILSQISSVSSDIPLDIRATAFQARVWQALRQIPKGETRTYSEVAQEIGQPTAVRAVARACASNPVALAVPCHRVIGSDGSLTGYRWGVERKQKLLQMEKK